MPPNGLFSATATLTPMASLTIELDETLIARLEEKAAADSTTVEALVVEAAARFLHTPEHVSSDVMDIIHRQIATYRHVFDRLAE
jgi:predicted transcriptional regulator